MKQYGIRVHGVILIIIICLLQKNEAGWQSECWKKHNAGSIQTPNGQFQRPFGILCTYHCLLWFPPIFPQCEFIFDLRRSRRLTLLPDCYEIRCNETFTLLGPVF